MAPTEILCEQQAAVFKERLEGDGVRVKILKGGQPKKKRRDIQSGIYYHGIDVVVGTHAVFQDSIEFADLRLVIIDEQHRFGTEQREKLIAKKKAVDVLVMSATPIPRTIAKTIYGDLDVSLIEDMPAGRRKIETQWLCGSDSEAVYETIRRECRESYQAYIVYPRIDSEEEDALKDLLSGRERIAAYLPDKRIEILHGRLDDNVKHDVMRRFKEREIDVLVSTTVVEVGIDNPRATVMVVVNADRFGLAQLHQLRGRVGRGERQSYCFLVTRRDITAAAAERMRIMCKYNDGFDISRQDMALRGSGEITGTKQAGENEFRYADYLRDHVILTQASEVAAGIISEDPDLRRTDHVSLWSHLCYYYRHSERFRSKEQ